MPTEIEEEFIKKFNVMIERSGYSEKEIEEIFNFLSGIYQDGYDKGRKAEESIGLSQRHSDRQKLIKWAKERKTWINVSEQYGFALDDIIAHLTN